MPVAARTTAEWLALFDELEIPAGPVNAIEDLADDPHLKAIGFFRLVIMKQVGACALGTFVHEKYRRQGVATEMWRAAQRDR